MWGHPNVSVQSHWAENQAGSVVLLDQLNSPRPYNYLAIDTDIDDPTGLFRVEIMAPHVMAWEDPPHGGIHANERLSWLSATKHVRVTMLKPLKAARQWRVTLTMRETDPDIQAVIDAEIAILRAEDGRAVDSPN